MPRKVKNHPYNFCYVCGELTFKSHRRFFTPLVNKCYDLYFGCKLDDLERNWEPHTVYLVFLLVGKMEHIICHLLF